MREVKSFHATNTIELSNNINDYIKSNGYELVQIVPMTHPSQIGYDVLIVYNTTPSKLKLYE